MLLHVPEETKRKRHRLEGPRPSWAYVVAEQARKLLFNVRHRKVEQPTYFEKQWEMLRIFRDKAEEVGWSLRQCRVYLGHRRTNPGTPDWTEPKADEPARPVLMVRVPLAALVELVMSVERQSR